MAILNEVDFASNRTSSAQFWGTVMDSRLAFIHSISADDSRGDIYKIQQSIADEVRSLRSLISFALKRSNELAVTTKLPPEFLVRILQFLQCDSGEQVLGWIGATHVCHSWREAALQHPRLWANLTFRFGVRWFSEMVSRAKFSPLAFTIDEYLPPSFKATDLSLRLVQRMQHVGVAALDQQLDIFASFLTVPMPLLETFSMERRDGSLRNGNRDQELFRLVPAEDEVVVIRPSLFVRPSSNLRRFRLHGCKMFGAFPPSPCMTHFEIYGPSATGQGSRRVYAFSSFCDLLDSVSNMPALETLVLNHNLFPRFGLVTGRSKPRVHLSSLKHLSIGGKPFECAALMAHLSIPPSATVNLECIGSRHPTSNGDANSELPLLLDALRVHAEDFRAGAPFFSICAAVSRVDFKLKIERCAGDEDEPSGFRRDRLPHMHLFMHGFGYGALPDLLDVFGSERIRTVSIGNSPGLRQSPFQLLASSAWIRIFKHCINVRRVHVGGCDRAVGEFLRALSVGDYSTEGARIPDLFPKMNVLHINIHTKTPEIFWDANDRPVTLARPEDLGQCMLGTMHARFGIVMKMIATME